MFNVGPEKLILLFVVALIVLGPKRLPDAARTLGRAVGELRRVTGGLQQEVRDALAEPKDALTAAMGELHGELNELRDFGRSALSGPVGGPPSDQAPRSETSGTLPPTPDDPSLN